MAEIKKYANRRLYDTDQSSFVTLEAIAERIADGEEISVVDAASGADITRSVLSQIVLQQEENGQGILPKRFLEQLIRHRNRSVKDLLAKTLPMAVDATLRMQREFRSMIESRGDRPGIPPEMVSLMFPWLDFTEAFSRALTGPAASSPATPMPAPPAQDPSRDALLTQISDLKEQLKTLENRLDSARAGKE